jgi:hypothetical protein
MYPDSLGHVWYNSDTFWYVRTICLRPTRRPLELACTGGGGGARFGAAPTAPGRGGHGAFGAAPIAPGGDGGYTKRSKLIGYWWSRDYQFGIKGRISLISIYIWSDFLGGNKSH